MGYGLGKNSPIVLTQSRSNFEALIGRHGQYVRWRTARKCPCIRADSVQPDIHCGKCGGSGDIYDYQKSYKDTLQVKVRSNIIELPAENINADILKVYDSRGNEFSFTKTGAFIEITGGARQPSQNEMISVLIRESIVKQVESVTLEKIGGGFYRVPGTETDASKIEGVYYRAPGDVLAVERVETPEGGTVEVRGFRQNMIHIDSDADILTAYGVDYILPEKFIMLSQNMEKEDEPLIERAQRRRGLHLHLYVQRSRKRRADRAFRQSDS